MSRPIIVTDDPNDKEAWVTESRERVRALVGIPEAARLSGQGMGNRE